MEIVVGGVKTFMEKELLQKRIEKLEDMIRLAPTTVPLRQIFEWYREIDDLKNKMNYNHEGLFEGGDNSE